MRVQIRLLGGFHAEMIGTPQEAVRISARKGQALLAYLAMRPDLRESRERLADLLWGDRVDAQARHSLRQCLVGLRRDLRAVSPDALTIEGETIALNAGLFAIDAVEFVAATEAADTGGLKRAVDLYRGEFLAGFGFDTEAFDEWIRLERSRLAELAVHAFRASAEAADAAGDGASAISTAERLVGFDPLCEEAQRLLLWLYARHRSRDAALAHAETFATVLRNELNVEPEAETVRLIEEIRQGIVPLAQPARREAHMLPAGPELSASGPIGGSETLQSNATGTDDSTPPGLRRKRISPAAAGAAAAVASIAVLAILWLSLERVGWQSSPRANSTIGWSRDIVAADQSWRSPGIYPGAAVDDASLAAAHRQALVVLPFAVDDSSDKAAQALARRITVDLIDDLSAAPSIRVISARTSQLYAAKPVDVAAIGAELGVHYVVEGSVRREQRRLIVKVTLTDAKTRLQTWSERFERDFNDRSAVQDELVKGVARALHVTVITSEGDRQPRGEPDSVGDQLAKGWAAIFRSNETGGPNAAKVHFENVLRVHPDHPSALTGLAAHHVMTLAFDGAADREALLDQAEPLLLRALEQRRSSPAYYYLGLAKKARGDLDAALESFAKAIAITPSHAPAYANAGHVLVRMGRLEEGIEHIRYAIRLSPKDPALPSWLAYRGEAEIARGSDDAAIEWLTRTITQSPRRPFARALLGAAYALKGDAAAAAQQVTEWKKLVPGLGNEALMTSLGGQEYLSPRLVQGLRLALDHSS